MSTNAIHQAINAICLLRAEGARVHCITNTVAQNFTANVLLACGATPSMTVSPDEVAHFTKRSDALLINLGTLSTDRKAAISASLATAGEGAKPVILDPVMCHVSPPRAAFAKDIVKAASILRANADEMAALSIEETTGLCIVETGQTDQIRFNHEKVQVRNGHLWLSKVTAVGCAQGGLIAALATKTDSPLIASLAALIWTGVSGEIAAGKSSGPGSFAANLLDALHTVSPTELEKSARIA